MRRACAVLVAVALLAGTAVAVGADVVEHRAVHLPEVSDDGLLTILVIGSDSGPPHRPGDPRRGRADTLQLVAVDPARRAATIVSIPRDSLAAGDRVNAPLALSGPDRQVAVVESLTGVDIDHWILTSFHGFTEMVDAIGGVTVDVERPMVDKDAQSNFPKAGPVHVDGVAALSFTRDRKSLPDGDFGRTRNGGRFLRFVHADVRARRPGLRELTRLTTELARHTESNIPTPRLLPLAALALRIEPWAVRHDALKGGFGWTRGGASIVHLRPGDSFARIRRGEVGP